MFLNSPWTILFQIGLTVLLGYGVSPAAGKVSIRLGGNAYITKRDPATKERIESTGLKGWSSKTAIISVYFKTSQAETFTVSLKLANPKANSKIRLGIGGMSRMAAITKSSTELSFGKFSAPALVYVKVNLQGISRRAGTFTDVTDLQLDGIKGQLTYVKEEANFYYGRRGPSANLAYTSVTADDVEYFYNEVTVPKGNDPISCYFMTAGTSEGYSGIQRNSQTERRFIFSIFSKYATDDPTKVPPEYRVKLLGKGPGVVTQDFGNEGSGGQSRLVYPWKTGVAYGFLIQTYPTDSNSTVITCWVNIPGEKNLRLIASFEQPMTSVYGEGFYSFSENFAPDQGYIPRMVMYGRTFYYRTSTKIWEEVTQGEFRVDDTGLEGRRKDYTGGTSGNMFVLRNIGFINDTTETGTQLTRQPSGNPPKFDLNNLP